MAKPNIVAYHVYDVNTRTWLCDAGDWSSSFLDSADFYDYDEVAQIAASQDSRDPNANIHVLATITTAEPS